VRQRKSILLQFLKNIPPRMIFLEWKKKRSQNTDNTDSATLATSEVLTVVVFWDVTV
jgi:hypothetical protein